MFGYIIIYKPEMKVKEFEIYNAIYCGLCRRIGKTYGVLAKFCLNYDMTFLSLLQMSFAQKCDEYEQKHCRANPLKKCTYCKDDGELQELAAAAAVSLADLKIADSVADSGFLRGLLFQFLRIFTKHWRKKSAAKYPELEDVVSEYENGQRKVEASDSCGIDMAAEPTANAVSRIFTMIECEEKYKFVLKKIGYCLGKWVYLCDAVDDLGKDIKHGGFNPLIANLTPGTNIKKYARERLEPVMNNCICECAKYSELLEPVRYKAIIDNILYDGLKNCHEKIFAEENKG